jgi:hypothetical protein
MFDLTMKHDIEQYSEWTRQAVQVHVGRQTEFAALRKSLIALEQAEAELTKAGQHAHCESITWTADQLDQIHDEAYALLKKSGSEVQREIRLDEMAIEEGSAAWGVTA